MTSRDHEVHARALRVTSMMKNRSHAIAKQSFVRCWQVDPLHARKRLNW
jgi:hypothetical protein